MGAHLLKPPALLALAMPVLTVNLHGQSTQLSPEEAVANYLERRATASWQPREIFSDCAVAGAWEAEAFRLLTSAALGNFHLDALANSWKQALDECDEPRLYAWYFGQIEGAIASGAPIGNYVTVWTALEEADSPQIRAFLRRMMLDESVPQNFRDAAGARYFMRMDDEELRREYFQIFATRQLPLQVSWFYTDKLIRLDAGRTLQEIAALVRQDPRLAHQVAFSQAVTSARQHASPADRRAFAEALEDVLARPGLLDRQQQRLNSAARSLRSGE